MSAARAGEGDWELMRMSAGACERPQQLPREGWSRAVVPGTVAMALGSAPNIDAHDHWYRWRFEGPQPPAAARSVLCCDGLATLAQVWLNGEPLFESDNMFVSHRHDVTQRLRSENELHIRFRALLPFLRERRPRGRFPTPFVSEKNLRFVRTTLIGYMPGICPAVRPVGPWRAVRLEEQDGLHLERVDLHPRLEGERGVLDVRIEGRSVRATSERAAYVHVGRDGRPELLEDARNADGSFVLRGRVVLEEVERWWPHTHGSPTLYPVTLELEGARIELGAVGFRALRLPGGDDWGLLVNDAPIFCRGACWMPLDIRSLHASEAAYRDALLQARDAGMNMLRVCGSMVYESDAFHRLCDELGILLWQDFMFARMDYPDGPELRASVELEARQLLRRIGHRPSLAVLCGNNEVAQQAAMMGMPADAARNPLFDSVLPELSQTLAEGVPYIASSPSGGEVPFHSGAGPSHYFGVGAYLRPIEDARLHPVRFASECLTFSNVPEDATLREWLGEDAAAAVHPRYEEAVPRDAGASWDFADVTEHYAGRLFGVDVRALRRSDPERYLALCRAALCEVMARVQAAWRTDTSRCRGALVLQLRDLALGAGWGIVDADGLPKSAYYALKRAWSPLGLWLTDDGLDGVTAHVANDTPSTQSLRLELELYRPDGRAIERASAALELAPRSQRRVSVDALIGRFVDSSHAYRFGPPAHDLVAARIASNGEVSAQAFCLPLGLEAALAGSAQADIGLSARAVRQSDGSYCLTAVAKRFAAFVVVDAPGFVASDNYFHLAPDEPWRIALRPRGRHPQPLRAELRSLRGSSVTAVQVDPEQERRS